jgi:hypothetical protein
MSIVDRLAAAPWLRGNCRPAYEAVNFLRWGSPLSHLLPVITASPAAEIGSKRVRPPKKY